jgi:hypothetical protein
MTQALDYVAAHPWVGWLFLGLLSLLVSQKSQVDAWAEKNPRVAGFMKLLRSLGIDPWLLVQSLSLIFRSKLPVKLQAAQLVAAAGTRVTPEVLEEVAKQSAPPPPDDGPPTPKTGAGASPIVALLLAGSLALSGALPACSSPPAVKDPAALGAAARNTARLAYSAGVLTVNALEEARIVWMRAQATPTAEQVALAERISTGLHAAKDALDRARPWLETGEGEAAAKKSLREGIESAELVANLLLGTGGAVPKVLTDGLTAARAALGSGS